MAQHLPHYPTGQTTPLSFGITTRETIGEFTARQGQYLAFICDYSKINRRAPAEADIQQYFQVLAPTVHQMVVTLESHGQGPIHTKSGDALGSLRGWMREAARSR